MLRIQGGERLPAGHFTETDAYFYYWQAQLVSAHGKLPERDMHRWLPLGRDLGQTLNLYGYVLSYTHKALAVVFRTGITLYHVCLYMPVVCFCIGLGTLCVFLYHIYRGVFSGVVGVLLAILPGSIERSAAGFGDRDAFCLMIGILAVITYLMSLQTQHRRKRLFWTLASGLTVFLGGISWEGFGVFLSVILFVELWRFLTTETENNLCLYLLWVLSFVPTLYLVSPAYRNGYGFAEHLFAFVLVPPVVLLGVRGLRYLLLSEVEKLRPHARTLSFGLALASIALAIGYVLIHLDTFADTTVPLSRTSLMQSITELKAPGYGYWVFRYGSVFIFGSVGLIFATQRHSNHTVLFVPIALFIATTFFREPLETYLWNASYGNFFFLIAMTCSGIGFLISAWCQPPHETRLMTSVAFMTWFVFWVALSRDAKRYDFFISVPLAFFTAELIHFFSNSLSLLVKEGRQRAVLKTTSAIALLVGILFLPPFGGYSTHAISDAARMRSSTPTLDVSNALRWMKMTLPNTAIVASHWGYGSQLNVLGGVKTITDQDTYLPNWIRLYGQHVHNAVYERDVLEYLKTHRATHLMFTNKDLFQDTRFYMVT